MQATRVQNISIQDVSVQYTRVQDVRDGWQWDTDIQVKVVKEDNVMVTHRKD